MDCQIFKYTTCKLTKITLGVVRLSRVCLQIKLADEQVFTADNKTLDSPTKHVQSQQHRKENNVN